jgi:hypothetical protein
MVAVASLRNLFSPQRDHYRIDQRGAARRAGTSVANTVTMITSSETAPIVETSRTLTPNSRC